MSDKMEIKLKWEGPYKFTDFRAGNGLPDENVAGIYLWVRNLDKKYRLHYVGQSKYLRERFSQHLTQLIGGGYYLYRPNDLSRDIDYKNLHVEYKSTNSLEGSFFKDFLPNLTKMQTCAHMNLANLSFFWVAIDTEATRNLDAKIVRESIESALIESGGKKFKIENSKVSRASKKAQKIKIISTFDCKYEVDGVEESIVYGEKEYG